MQAITPVSPPRDMSQTVEKKRKKKKRRQPDEDHGQDVDEPVKKKKKKNKNKGKGKERDREREESDAEIEAKTQETAAALLSAIVAASVGPQQQPFPPPPPNQFEGYPPMYPYPMMPFDPNAPQSVFPTPQMPGPPQPFSDMTFNSNDDVLRVLQDLDITKIANALRCLSDSSPAPQTPAPAFAPQLSFLPDQLDPSLPGAPQFRPMPSAPSARASTSAQQQQTCQTPGMTFPNDYQHAHPEHAVLLATKWLNAGKLAELAANEGLVYKKGKFSNTEIQQLHAAVEKYQIEKGMSLSEVRENVIFAKHDKNRDNAFWTGLTAAVPFRPIIAVYHFIRRHYHPCNSFGIWRPEEDRKLKEAIADIGTHWEKISLRVGRMASDCRDRWRNHLINEQVRNTGPWSKEEEEKLIGIVTDMTIKQGKDQDNDVFWTKVSKLMGGVRGRQQCRIKWTDSLSKTIKNAGDRPRWSPRDAYILIHRIASLPVNDDSEIDWKTLSTADWNFWSAHTLQRRWITLKRGVKGYEDMTHQEILEILKLKRPNLPDVLTAQSRKRKARKVTSAEAINDSETRDGVEESDASSSSEEDSSSSESDKN